MLRVGIITLSASDNCGSLLQTHALQQVLSTKFECDVEIINFSSPESRQLYDIFPKNIYRHPKKLLFALKYVNELKKQKEGYEFFRRNYLNMTSEMYTDIKSLESLNGHYDILVAGSDQVWNVYMADYSDAFFLPWDKQARKIAYATSLGSTRVIDNEKEKQVKLMLETFSKISVREETGKETIQKLTDKEVEVTLDPTLLIPEEEWSKLAGERQVKEKYIFYYSWAYPDKSMNLLVEKFAKEKNLKVIVINSSKWRRYRPEKFGFELYEQSGPLVFLNLMKYAEYVFVQSFHGAVFANLLRKRFFFLNEREDGEVDFRTKNIIGILHQERQIVHNLDDIYIGMETELSYTSTELEIAKEKSFNFLSKAISGEGE